MPLRITELPSTPTIDSGDFFPISQFNGIKRATYKVTTNQIKNFITYDLSLRVDENTVNLTKKVSISGDTMTGYLTLVNNPINPYHASTKLYVDNRINSLSSSWRNFTDSLYFKITGGSLLNYLTLHANPVNSLHAATKSYVDTNVLNINNTLTNLQNVYVKIAGSTMSGHLTLFADPAQNKHAATKQYVDNVNSSNSAKFLKLSGGSLSGPLNLHANPTLTTHAATKAYVDSMISSSNNSTISILTNYVPLNGGVMSGYLVLNGDPIQATHASTKQYVDTLVNKRLSIDGGSLNGFLTLNSNPTQTMHAATKAYVDSIVQTNVTNITNNVNNIGSNYVKLAGDTMSGPLTLNASPTLNNHAATKAYVDSSIQTNATITTNNVLNTVASNYVKLAGDTMSGTLTLNASPTLNNHAANKQYVDNNLQFYIKKPSTATNGQSLVYDSSTNSWIAGNTNSSSDGTPVGTISYFASNTPPPGWLECNGTTLNKNVYVDLFNVIGYTYGGASDNFVIPDLRGEFIRGWDNGRTIDVGRSFGSWQSEEFKSHSHGLDKVLTWPSRAGYPAVAEQHQRGNPDDYSAYMSSTSNIGGSETRPRNVALLPCIKYANNSSLNALGLQASNITASLANFVSFSNFSGANNQSLTNNGFQKLPGGLIIQWGYASGNATTPFYTTVNFPVDFPNQALAVYASNGDAQGSFVDNVWASIISKSQFKFGSKGSPGNASGFGGYWFAIGF